LPVVALRAELGSVLAAVRARVFGEFEPVISFFVSFLSLLLCCKLFYSGFVRCVKWVSGKTHIHSRQFYSRRGFFMAVMGCAALVGGKWP
jgi:hypothetical protein